MEPEVGHGEAEVYAGVQASGRRLIKDRGVSYAQAEQDLSVHQSQLRNWVKAFSDDPRLAFPGQGQMKPAQAGSRGSSARRRRNDSRERVT